MKIKTIRERLTTSIDRYSKAKRQLINLNNKRDFKIAEILRLKNEITELKNFL
jgi:hypothetical protein